MTVLHPQSDPNTHIEYGLSKDLTSRRAVDSIVQSPYSVLAHHPDSCTSLGCGDSSHPTCHAAYSTPSSQQFASTATHPSPASPVWSNPILWKNEQRKPGGGGRSPSWF